MKEIIASSNAPKALGPYSHAISMEGMVFTSGQIGIDPATNALAPDVESQTVQALKNLGEVLKAGGASVKDVVKTTVFVTDMNDFAKVNKIYGEFFGSDFPARSCVQIGKLPGGAQVEIEAIAFKSADETYNF